MSAASIGLTRAPGRGASRRKTIDDTTAVLALAVAVAAIVSATIAIGGVPDLYWAAIATALYGTVATLLGFAAIRGLRWPWHPLSLPMAGFGGLVLLQWCLGLSAYAGATLTGALELGAAASVFLLGCVAFSRPGNLKYFTKVAWLGCGAAAAEALVQFFLSPNMIYGRIDASYGTPMGPFVYHNFYAGLMVLLLPLACVVAGNAPLQGGGDTRSLALARRAIFPVLGLVSVFLSQSRSGVLALAVEFALFVAVTARRRGIARSLGLVAAAALFFWILASYGTSGLLSQRFANLARGDASAEGRQQAALSCLSIFRDHPWLGAGFNTFDAVYPRYKRFDDGKEWETAHNEYAQALAETGLAGTLCILTFIGLLMRSWWRVSRARLDSVNRMRHAAFIAAFGFLFFSYEDFQFHAFSNALLFFLVVAAATCNGARSGGTAKNGNGTAGTNPASR